MGFAGAADRIRDYGIRGRDHSRLSCFAFLRKLPTDISEHHRLLDNHPHHSGRRRAYNLQGMSLEWIRL